MSRFAMSLVPSLFNLLILVSTLDKAAGHGRLIQPRARNLNDNGAVAGGPGSVHSYTAGKQSKYKHGICGNPSGGPQNYNKVGDVQATYVSGSIAELKVTITAHHVGYFEFELCMDAGLLSEDCFMMHRLLKEGCHCQCANDPTHSCADCDRCRRWWKPLLEGEMGQFVARGYSGPALPGQGNLVPYEFIMRYVIPSDVKSRRAVLRWHYVTTNSCTSMSSAPEEFWNCADVSITDASGDAGGKIDFDNNHLQSMVTSDLMPMIETGELRGVYSRCPQNEDGLVGVASGDEYACGERSGQSWQNCKDLSAGSGSLADCSDPPSSGIICESECSATWFQCANGVAYTKKVPTGTKCTDGSFVLAASCASGSGWDDTTLPPTQTEAPTVTSTRAPTTAEPTTLPTRAPTTAEPTTLPVAPKECGSCRGCLWSTGECYADVASAAYCNAWRDNTWCGSAAALVQESAQEVNIKPHRQRFLGSDHALVQNEFKLHPTTPDEL